MFTKINFGISNACPEFKHQLLRYKQDTELFIVKLKFEIFQLNEPVRHNYVA